VQPGHSLRVIADAVKQADIDDGKVCFQDLYEAGRLLFEHAFVPAEGMGHALGPAGKGPYRRVHFGRFGGPDTLSCTSCHWRGGNAGAGGMPDNTFIGGDGDAPASSDARNPPALQGVGAAQAVAAEMTADLQAQRAAALDEAKRAGRAVSTALASKGTFFGSITARPDGSVDASGVEGVDADLVVKPFGWKGSEADLRSFLEVSLQVHFGIQSDDLLARHRGEPDLLGNAPDPDDPDGDGVTHELTAGPLTALVAYVASLEQPVMRPHEALDRLDPAAPGLPRPTRYEYLDEWTRGRALFDATGCASCHVPVMVLRSPVLRIESPTTGTAVLLDLSRHGEEPRLSYDPLLGGWPVWAFSDFKRHDMGEENAALREQDGVAPREYLTRRLWGLAQSAPYFYDGRAATLDAAISAHGGEAAAARDAFAALGANDQGALRVFLVSLRRERRVLVP
jgi:hypothetical protein